MTKPRVPHTWADAMTRVAGRIGWEAARMAVGGLGERMLRRWSDPEDDRWPSLDQALALDAAYLADGGEEAPFLAAFSAQLDTKMADTIACHQALLEDAATVAREMGDAVASSIAVARPGASPLDIHRAVVEAREAETAVGKMLRRLISFLPQGVGSGAGKAGGQPT